MALAKTIITLLIIALIVWLLWYLFFSNKNSIHTCQDGTKSKTIKAEKLSGKKGSSNFTWSIWFYVSDWHHNLGKKKILLQRTSHGHNTSADPHSGQPLIYLDPYENNLSVVINTMKQKRSGHTEHPHCSVANIPLQRWVNAIVSLNNRTLDVYIQGKLVRTCILPGVASIHANSPAIVTPHGGFKGFTSNYQYFDHPLNPQEAYNIYANGPGCGGQSWFDKYQIRLSYLVNNKEEGYIVV